MPNHERTNSVREPRFFSRDNERQLILNGHGLSALYGSHAPAAVPQPVENWHVFSLACLARAHYTLVTVLDLQHREVDCISLTRTLYEHVIAFAWVAIEPETHYPMFLRWELIQRKRMCDDLARFGVVAPPFDEVKRALVDAAHECAPDTADRALQADAFWSRLHPDWEWGFRRSYANLFRQYSAFVHPTVMGLESFITRGPTGPKIGIPPKRAASEAAASAVASFADALVVAHLRLRWPPFPKILSAFTAGIVAP